MKLKIILNSLYIIYSITTYKPNDINYIRTIYKWYYPNKIYAENSLH